MTTIIPKYDPECKYTPTEKTKTYEGIEYRIWLSASGEEFIRQLDGRFEHIDWVRYSKA